MQATFGHIKLNHVAVFNQGQGPTCRCLRGNVQHYRAVSRAAHARIRDADHVGDTLFKNLRRQWHIANLCHAWVAFRAAVLEHHDASFIDIQFRAIDTLMKVFDVFKHHRAPAMLQ